MLFITLGIGLLFCLPLLSLASGKDLTTPLSSLFESITTGVAKFVSWFTVLMALVQVTVVILRYVFGLNFIWMQESLTYMHGAVFLLASGFVLLTNEHVRVDIFYRESSPRRKALVDLVGTYIFLLPICLLILWASLPYVARSWAIMESSTEATGIHAVFLLKTMIPIFAVLLLMAGFTIASRAISKLSPQRQAI